MSPNPRFSVVIPALNEARHIRACLQSILDALSERESEDVEVIVVDNGSTDDTREIARAFQAKILSAPAALIGELRNRGCQSATGDWIVFIDADCTVCGKFFDELAKAVEKHPGEMLGLTVFLPEPPSYTELAYCGRAVPPEGLAEMICGAGMVLPRALFHQLGRFRIDLRAGEDVEFSTRAKSRGVILRRMNHPQLVHHGNPKGTRELYLRAAFHGNALRYLFYVNSERNTASWLLCWSAIIVALVASVGNFLNGGSSVPIWIFGTFYLLALAVATAYRCRKHKTWRFFLANCWLTCVWSAGMVTGLLQSILAPESPLKHWRD